MIHKCWPLGTFLTPFLLRPSLYFFPCITHHARSPPRFSCTLPPLSPRLLHPFFPSPPSSPTICTALNIIFVDRMPRCITEPVTEQSALSSAASWFIQKQVVPGEDRSRTGSGGGGGEGEGRPRQNSMSVLAWFRLRGKWDTNICMWLHHETVLPRLSCHLTSVTHTVGVGCTVGLAETGGGVKRGKEAKSKKK